MWLLDANMDVHLKHTLREFGQDCDTATNRGWNNLSNGELVSKAVTARFTCLLTRDRLFGESAAQALRIHPDFAVVVVDLHQRRSDEHQKQFRAAWLRSPIVPKAGQLIRWPE